MSCHVKLMIYAYTGTQASITITYHKLNCTLEYDTMRILCICVSVCAHHIFEASFYLRVPVPGTIVHYIIFNLWLFLSSFFIFNFHFSLINAVNHLVV